jgi:threonine dehydrogenase-like Zn-dependent dehydrogenase
LARPLENGQLVIALRFKRSVPRYAAAKVAGRAAPGLVPHLAPLRLGHYDDPDLPGAGWVRVAPTLSGICGSDLAMLSGDASFYFSPIISMPFVPGHEIVGVRQDTKQRVVVEPVLACAARGIDPPCEACTDGHIGLCTRTAHGHIAPALQTGFCEDTGGGWGTMLAAHESQLHEVPDDLSDEAAVLIEPLACAVHAVLRAATTGPKVLVSGAGTMGLLTIAALHSIVPDVEIIAVAKHDRQRLLAEHLGAHQVVRPDAALRAIRLATRSDLNEPEQGRPWLTGGVDASFECAGNESSLDTCLRATRARGRVVLVGLPTPSRIDLAPVWHRELQLMGAYTYGREVEGWHTFDLAFKIARRVDLTPLVSARYPLTRYAEAIDHAMDAGRLNSVKVVFDLGQR